jgi:AbrB family looped-hinge helix DNA binding protein
MTVAARTRLSTKGQMILPKAIRVRRKWDAGTELSVEDTPEGVLITSVAARPLFPLTSLDDVAGCLKPYYNGLPISIDDMDRAITDEVRDRNARGRY